MNVKSIKEKEIMEELKNNKQFHVIHYIKTLKKHLELQSKLTALAISKLKTGE